MEGAYQVLIDAVDTARDERSIRAALRRFVLRCGFERYAYLHAWSSGVATFTDYPAEWQQLYRQNLYSNVDPVVSKARSASGVFAWSADDKPLSRRDPSERAFFRQAIDHGIRSGITIPLDGSFGRKIMLTLATQQPGSVEYELGDTRRAAVALTYVHLKLNAIIESAARQAEQRLTVQEITCLNWSSLGKYMPEIALILGIEHRTVQFHLDNARSKLGAVNLPHAVRIAMERKLI